MSSAQSDPQPNPRPVLVVDFGSQFSQLIARRVRELGYYSQVVPYFKAMAQIQAVAPVALISAGGPRQDAHGAVWRELLSARIPLLTLGLGAEQLTSELGGGLAAENLPAGTVNVESSATPLFQGISGPIAVWSPGGRALLQAPRGFEVIAQTVAAGAASYVAGIASADPPVVALWWHPEVRRSEAGATILQNFLAQVAQAAPNWHSADIIADQIARIRQQVGTGRALCGLSGGVDSAVAAALVQQAIGDQLTCVFVDHGLLRAGEAEQVERDFVAATGVKLVVADARDRFLTALQGVSDPEEKRKIIGREFIREFEAQARQLSSAGAEPIKFLVQGTVYPDVVESGATSAGKNIKSHHNVGGLPPDLDFELVEPLRELFKDEVRAVGTDLGLPEELVWRHPFPGPGLGVRIIGEVTAARLDILRAADQIVRTELSAAGLDREIWQCPVVLLADVKSVGVKDESRHYGYPIVLRPVISEDAMTAEWYPIPYELLGRISAQITAQVPEVVRVVLDVTNKPPGTIEWE